VKNVVQLLILLNGGLRF